MSVAFAKRAFQKFLADLKPDVLCIKGNWGTGKTYAWDEAVQEATKNNRFAMKKYAYVSLFGVKESSDIMQAIFATADSPGGTRLDRLLPETIAGHKAKELDLWKRFKSAIGFAAEHATVPHIAGLGGVARAVLASLVGDTLVCIDDFERKAASVSVNEIMGVIAQLRDARRCKVVLILNEDSLDEKEKAEFHRYSEKVINRIVRFVPTEAEAAAVAFPNADPLSGVLRTYCERLGITNIRIMFNIRDIASDIIDIMPTVDDDIRDDVLKQLVVLVWAAASPAGEGAPTIDYLKGKRAKQSFGSSNTTYSAEEVEWGVLLNDYGFSHCDDLDLLMIEGTEDGFFNDEKLGDEIGKLVRNTAKIRAEKALTDAWSIFHESFDDNPDDVAKALYSGCMENIQYLTPINLSSAVTILKDTGHVADADSLLKTYMETRHDLGAFDLEDHPFGDDVKDAGVRQAFAQKAKAVAKPTRDPVEAAQKIRTGSWNPEDEKSLASLEINDFKTMFKSLRGKARRDVIFGSISFSRVSNATPVQVRIAERARAALREIGRESPLNAHRLGAYGVTVLDEAKAGVGEKGTDSPDSMLRT